jgi:cytochrome c
MAMRVVGQIMKAGLVVATTAALAACGQPSQEPTVSESETTAAVETPAVAGPPPAFAQCMSCHAVKPGVNGVGPSLFGVVGRKAGTLPGYPYSDALKAWGRTLDEATLDEWLTAPMKDVPGTKMVFPGMPDPERRKAIIEYLESLHD